MSQGRRAVLSATMSAIGTKRTSTMSALMSAFGGKADMPRAKEMSAFDAQDSLAMGGFYTSAKWFRARKQALHDAGHMCTTCGTSLAGKGREAHVHHRKELTRAPALAIEPQNLVALCRNCHSKLHRQKREPF